MPKNWADMSSNERQESLFQSWLAPQGVKFLNAKAEKSYQERVTRLKDVIQMKKMPDRVPIVPMTGFFPAFNAGLTPKDVMYDYSKIPPAWKKYVSDLQPRRPWWSYGGSAGQVLRYSGLQALFLARATAWQPAIPIRPSKANI